MRGKHRIKDYGARIRKQKQLSRGEWLSGKSESPESGVEKTVKDKGAGTEH